MHNGALTKTNSHPCFFSEAKDRYGRIHLPVAPSCNIQCAYCRRDYDCIHENRPGVTKSVFKPEQALAHLERTLGKMPNISVAGIAGPGDAFSDPELTLKTFELIREKDPQIALCVSTNGLNIKKYIPRLADLNVRYVTITINSIDPAIGSLLYKWIKIGNTKLYGIEAVGTLIEKQLEAITILKEQNFTVKVNSVVIPGINDAHLAFLAKKMGSMGVDLMNLIPIIPVKGTDMESVIPPGKEMLYKLRKTAGSFVTQMHHCTRCRSDAAGMLGDMRKEHTVKTKLKAYPLLLIIISFFLSLTTYGCGEKSFVKPEEVTTLKQTEQTSPDKQKKILSHCESEVDRQICNTINKALALYYQIANHEPQGSYERDNSMRILSQSIGITRQSTINDFVDTDSIKMYTAFISFINLNEKAEKLNLNKDFDEAGSTREKADKHHDEILNYCKSCLEELE